MRWLGAEHYRSACFRAFLRLLGTFHDDVALFTVTHAASL